MEVEQVFAALDDNPEWLDDYLEANSKLLEKFVVENREEKDLDTWKGMIKQRIKEEKFDFAAVDFLMKLNQDKNNTSEYDHNQLIVRRANNFHLSLRFKGRQYDSAKDKLTLTFGLGKSPSESNKTLISCVVTDKPSGKNNSWNCHVVSRDNGFKTIVVQVNIPSNAVVARYMFKIILESNTKTTSFKKNDILVIFNPFSPADDVYMESEAERHEYVLNDEGGIPVGSYTKKKDTRTLIPWYFGQFDKHILDTAFMLLNNDKDTRVKKFPVKSLLKRKFPAYCCRLLSGMVNSNNNEGLLVGNWSGDYDDGIKPTTWKGSVRILQQWHMTKKSVKYGQCWVFSGVMTTLLRALGIPSRSVTNFQSGHDSRMDAVIDEYYFEDKERYTEHESDSIWNFHVWNEAFFKRPNLPQKYSGWQAVDATPQEESNNIFQCGPSPVHAIKNGDMAMPHDTPFIFGEVNADKIVWWVDKEDKVVGMVSRSTSAVGTMVSTKQVGKHKMQDITANYKHPEGSTEERAIFNKAFSLAEGYDDERPPLIGQNEMGVEVNVDEQPEFGKDMDFSFKVRNSGKVARNVTVSCSIGVKNYTGKTVVKSLSAFTKTLSLKQHTEMTFKRNMIYQDYIHLLKGSETLDIQVNMMDVDNKEFAFDTDVFELKMPDMITVKEPTVPMTDDSVYIVEVENKLTKSLTNAIVLVEGKGVKTSEYPISGALAPGDKTTIEVHVKVPFTKFLNHNITLQSKELENSSHYERIKVKW